MLALATRRAPPRPLERPWQAALTVEGAPGAAEVLLRLPMTDPVTFPAGLALSRAVAGTAATAQAVLSIRRNGLEFGSATFAAGAASATFAAPETVAFAAGDVLTVLAPASPDPTLAGLGLVLRGAFTPLLPG